MDIGDATNLHPTNKRELGRRLAVAARHLIYGERIPPSGPVVSAVTRRGSDIVVTFRDVTGTLAIRNGNPGGFDLCGATQASCRWAETRVQGNSVALSNSGNTGNSTRVRYAWGESPRYSLYDASGLPAGPFEMTVR